MAESSYLFSYRYMVRNLCRRPACYRYRTRLQHIDKATNKLMGRLFGCRLLGFERVPLLTEESFILYKAPMGNPINLGGVGCLPR